MPAIENGFAWSNAATVATIICAFFISIAVVLFWIFGRRKEVSTDDLDLFYAFEEYPRAVLGAIFRGKKKDVTAQEYIATLMSLTHANVLSILSDEEGKGIGLYIDSMQVKEKTNPIDQKAIELLRLFAEDGNTVYLSTAKEVGNVSKEHVDAAYKNWKQLVRAKADDSITASRMAVRVQKGLLYAGYVCILSAALSSYFFSLAVSTVFLLTGGVIIALSMVMQRNVYVERQRARRLGAFLINGLNLYREEISEDPELAQKTFEYACVFGIADKVALTFEKSYKSPILEKLISDLAFWKSLKYELYTAQ